MPAALRYPLCSSLLALVLACGARRATGTAREAMIGAPEPLSHVEVVISGISQTDAQRLERQFKNEGSLRNALLKNYLSGKAVYEMDVRGCECDLPARFARIPHPGLRYEGRTTRVDYTAFDNEPPQINLVHPPLWKVVSEKDAYVLVEVPDPDVAQVKINGVVAELFRGSLYRARVHFEDGPRELSVVAVDQSGNEGTLRRRLLVDTSSSQLRTLSRVKVTGTVAPGSVVLVDGQEVPVEEGGHYTVEVRVQRGQRTVEVISLDAAGSKSVILKPLDVGREEGR